MKLKVSSLFGAGLGFWLMGPIGAIIGFALGGMFDPEKFSGGAASGTGDNRDGFLASLLVLMAAVMKADGKVVKAELDFVKVYLVRSLGQDKASQALLMMREIIKQDIPLNEVCDQIKMNMGYNSRLELIHMLFGVANADGHIPQSEITVIKNISQLLGIQTLDFESVMNMYHDDLESAYKVLELDSEASIDEVKKAYRKMAIKFHPDKVAHLGEEFQVNAKEKFQKVNEAYEKIKKVKNFS